MSDTAAISPTNFLRHIVEKSLGAERTITPRLPSLFEPGAGTIAVDFAEDAQQPAPQLAPLQARQQAPQHVQLDVQRADAPPTVPKPSRMPAARAVATHSTDAASGASVGAPLRQSQSTGVNDAHQTDSAPAPHAPPAPPAARRAIAPAPEPGRAADAPSRPAVAASTDILAATSSQLARAPQAGQAVPVSRAHPDRTERVPAAQPQPGPAAVQGSLRPAPLAPPMPPAQRPSTARGERQSQASAQQQEPVINVTIGRVEVRAVAGAPGQPRPEAAKSKPLSLDDYLKRNEVRR